MVVEILFVEMMMHLQEGKGGGLGQALGGHAQTTFGVGAKGINQFTGYCAAVFLGSAVLIHVCQERLEGRSSMEFADQPGLSGPIEGGAAGGATNTTSEER